VTYTKNGYFGYAGGGKNGAVVDMWIASRFGGTPPQENQAPPGPTPDAGPVTTANTFGGPGSYYITGITQLVDYYVRIQYGGNTYWNEAPANTLGGAPPGGGGISSVSSPDSSITVTNPTTTPTLQLTPLTGDVTTAASAATLHGTTNVESIITANTTVAGALQKTGGTMSGAIAMGSNKVTGLTNGSAAQDAVAFGQLPPTTWTAYTPTFTASTTNPSIGNGTLLGSYWQFGKLLAFNIEVGWGSTTSIGSGVYSFGLPVACVGNQVGSAEVVDHVSGGPAPAVAYMASTTTLSVQFYTTGPFAYGAPNFNGSGSLVLISGVFQAS
jgi:hypothetical protein